MAALAVVEDLDSLEDRALGHGSRGEALTVHQLALQRGEEALGRGMSYAVPTAPIEARMPESFNRRPNANEVNCVPWSE